MEPKSGNGSVMDSRMVHWCLVPLLRASIAYVALFGVVITVGLARPPPEPPPSKSMEVVIDRPLLQASTINRMLLQASPIVNIHLFLGQSYVATVLCPYLGAGFYGTRFTANFSLSLEYGWYSGGDDRLQNLDSHLDLECIIRGYNRLLCLMDFPSVVDAITILEHPTSLPISVSLLEMVCFMEGHTRLQTSISIFLDMLELCWILGGYACISIMSFVLGLPSDTPTILPLIVGMRSLCGRLSTPLLLDTTGNATIPSLLLESSWSIPSCAPPRVCHWSRVDRVLPRVIVSSRVQSVPPRVTLWS